MLMQHIAAAAILFAQCLLSFDAPRTVAVPAGAFTGAADLDADRRLDFVSQNGGIVYGSSRTGQLALNPGETVLAVADLNGDRRPDVLVASPTAIVVFLNNGNGTFTRKTTPGPISTTTSFLADFNGDGFPDLFTQFEPAYLGNGDGTFTRENGIAFSGQGRWIAADVNGDGRDDLVAIGPTPGQALVYLRDANGFQTGKLGPFVSGAPVAVADFDGDGRDDILFVPPGNNGTPALYFNLGGTAARENVALDNAAYAVADLNNDGAPDLVSGVITGDLTVRALLNDGHGTMRAVYELQGFDEMPVVVDGDGDHIPDLIGMRSFDTFLIHGNGDGTFRAPRIPLNSSSNGVSGDFDGDGDDDMAVSGMIAWNNGDNTFRNAPANDSRLGRLLAAADFDGDGKAEIVSALAESVSILSPRPDGSFVELASLPVKASVAAAGNFSGDGRLELAVVVIGTQSDREVQVFEIRSGAAPRFSALVSGPARDIAAADMNGDGADDIVVAGGTVVPPPCCHNFVSTSTAGFVALFLSTRSSFEPERVTQFPLVGLDRVATGDFDADGKKDVAAATLLQGRSVFALFGDGSGSFPRKQEIAIPARAGVYVLRADDFNGDGVTDLSVTGDVARFFIGSRTGLLDNGRYFGAFNLVALSVRPYRGSLPSLVSVPQRSSNAFIYKPTCARERGVRH